ncbi:hypothetical protein QQ008_20150 [Fulvivirgaceae bacterium BMA10]|uniref:Host attachment protein n=1 Tax=Splendidivirga corallicola TaxID=3051826 RepID=A0ABT8KTI9_9BACT|nr:hypothetical protein [Fulvivirgaceae bacterium BMA10]
MKKQLGIWIDTERAVLVALSDGHTSVETIFSDVERITRDEGEGKEFTRFGDQYLDLERKKERRLENQTKQFLDKVIAQLKSCDEFVIFGPAEKKTALKKLIATKPDIAQKLCGVQTADSMTDNQLVAWVKEYFKE